MKKLVQRLAMHSTTDRRFMSEINDERATASPINCRTKSGWQKLILGGVLSASTLLASFGLATVTAAQSDSGQTDKQQVAKEDDGVVKYLANRPSLGPAPAAALPTTQSAEVTDTKPQAAGIYASLSDFAADKRDSETVEVVELASQANSPEGQADLTVARDAVAPQQGKQFVDPSRFRVESDSAVVAVPETERLPIVVSAAVERLPQVVRRESHSLADSANPVNETVQSRHSQFQTVNARFEDSSIVQHVASHVPVLRLPPVIPSTHTDAVDPGEESIHVMSISDSKWANHSPGNRPRQDTDMQIGKPELVNLRDIANPLARVDYPTDDKQFGMEIPDDRSAEEFGPNLEPPFSQGLPRNMVVDGIRWAPSFMFWEAPGTFHRPLYFEQPNVERYGHYVPRWQTAISGAHFFGSLMVLPYKMYVNPPCEPIYTLGHYRPGSCNPHQIHYLPVGR